MFPLYLQDNVQANTLTMLFYKNLYLPLPKD